MIGVSVVLLAVQGSGQALLLALDVGRRGNRRGKRIGFGWFVTRGVGVFEIVCWIRWGRGSVFRGRGGVRDRDVTAVMSTCKETSAAVAAELRGRRRQKRVGVFACSLRVVAPAVDAEAVGDRASVGDVRRMGALSCITTVAVVVNSIGVGTRAVGGKINSRATVVVGTVEGDVAGCARTGGQQVQRTDTASAVVVTTEADLIVCVGTLARKIQTRSTAVGNRGAS